MHAWIRQQSHACMHAYGHMHPLHPLQPLQPLKPLQPLQTRSPCILTTNISHLNQSCVRLHVWLSASSLHLIKHFHRSLWGEKKPRQQLDRKMGTKRELFHPLQSTALWYMEDNKNRSLKQRKKDGTFIVSVILRCIPIYDPTIHYSFLSHPHIPCSAACIDDGSVTPFIWRHSIASHGSQNRKRFPHVPSPSPSDEQGKGRGMETKWTKGGQQGGMRDRA